MTLRTGDIVWHLGDAESYWPAQVVSADVGNTWILRRFLHPESPIAKLVPSENIRTFTPGAPLPQNRHLSDRILRGLLDSAVERATRATLEEPEKKADKRQEDHERKRMRTTNSSNGHKTLYQIQAQLQQDILLQKITVEELENLGKKRSDEADKTRQESKSLADDLTALREQKARIEKKLEDVKQEFDDAVNRLLVAEKSFESCVKQADAFEAKKNRANKEAELARLTMKDKMRRLEAIELLEQPENMEIDGASFAVEAKEEMNVLMKMGNGSENKPADRERECEYKNAAMMIGKKLLKYNPRREDGRADSRATMLYKDLEVFRKMHPGDLALATKVNEFKLLEAVLTEGGICAARENGKIAKVAQVVGFGSNKSSSKVTQLSRYYLSYLFKYEQALVTGAVPQDEDVKQLIDSTY